MVMLNIHLPLKRQKFQNIEIAFCGCRLSKDLEEKVCDDFCEEEIEEERERTTI